MKTKFIALITVGVLVLNAIFVYFGRIYFPKNFGIADKVTFFENYWVLTVGECFVIFMIVVFGWCAWYFGKLLIKDIKNIRNFIKK